MPKFFNVLVLIILCNSHLFSQSNTEKKLIREYSSEQNPDARFWKLYNLSKFYQLNNYQKADSIRKTLLTLSYSSSDSARYLSQVFDAEVDLSNGDKELYFSKVLELQSFLSQQPTREIKVDLHQRLAEYHLYHREMDEANSALKSALKLSKKLRNNKEISETYKLLSQIYMLKNQKDSANYFTLECIQFARRSANRRVLAESFNNQATIFNYFGQIELSAAKNISALKLANEEADYVKIARYSINIGEAQLTIQNYKEAEFHFLLAIENASRIKDKRTVALAQINLGVVYKNKKDYIKALDYERKALKLLQPYNDYEGLGNAHNTIGDIFREQKDFTKALSNYNKALVYFESSSNKEKIATVYHNVGYVFEKQGKYENALNYLNRSVQIRSQFGYQGSVYPTYQTISDVYFKTGNQVLAYKYLKMYADYSDSAKTLESTKEIAELSETYRSEERERDNILKSDSIERQRQKIALNTSLLENSELKTNLQTYIIIGFVILMMLAGIIGFYRWNQTKIKSQQQQAEMNQTLLRAQMNPHFVFNAMSVIQSYIYDNDTKNSSKFLVNFSKLMRLILENSSKESIPIKTEFEILDKYLNIQKMRFEDRFEYSILVDEILYDEENIIPPMITQPFIENAIEHGRLHLKEDGFINIHFFKHENMLRITVEDNGIGRKGSEMNKKSKEHKSMAMKITKERIDNLNKKYRSDGFMQIEDYNKEEGTGTKVLISIPYRVENQI
ncbi:MAG: tetratricopeptide repeat protein [Bacteroidota bacterium]